MNKQRRATIDKINSLFTDALEMLQEVIEEEQEAFDNLPEGIQESERGEKIQEYLEVLNDAYDYIEEQNENLYEIANE